MNKNNKDNKLFRTTALENLSTPEQLDQMMQVMNPKAWLFLVNIVLLIIIFTIWGIFGRISLKIEGQGILIKHGGIHTINIDREGRIGEIYIETGDIVEKQQVIASIIIEIFPQEFKISNRSESFPGKLIQQDSYDLSSKKSLVCDIVSPFTGKVLEIKVLPGSTVSKNSTIVSLETLDQNLEAILYINPLEGKKIFVGSNVEIVPANIRKERFGFIKGEVKSISEFPATPESMLNFLKNQNMVSMFSGEGPPIEVVVNLEVCDETISGYKWSSQQGPPKKINSGTLCEAQIVYETQRPIALLLLWLREKFLE